MALFLTLFFETLLGKSSRIIRLLVLQKKLRKISDDSVAIFMMNLNYFFRSICILLMFLLPPSAFSKLKRTYFQKEIIGTIGCVAYCKDFKILGVVFYKNL